VSRSPRLARRFFDRFEPVHAVTYFAPECRRALDDLGFPAFWMGYFAARSAPLGAIPASVVTALFYNFHPDQVAKALPAAWEFCTPEDTLQTRLRAAAAALRRYGVSDAAGLHAAADLCAQVAKSAPVDGRALAAANAAVPWPEDPLEKLWQATTVLREQRGDGHIAALVAAGITGRQSNILHCAAGGVPAEFIKASRRYDDDEWQLQTQSLADRGLMRPDGSLTDAGRDLKEHLESRTDAVALSALECLDDAQIETLFQTLTPITRLVVAGGDVPAATPMGLRRDELDDDGAHIG
jgi:hypothetical protein